MLSHDETVRVEIALLAIRDSDPLLHNLVEFTAQIGATLDEIVEMATARDMRIENGRIHVNGDRGPRTVWMPDDAYALIPFLSVPGHRALQRLRSRWLDLMHARRLHVPLDAAIGTLAWVRAEQRTDDDTGDDTDVPF